MSEFVCEYCGWSKGKTENALRAHVNLHCKENPNRKQKPILESEGAGHKPEAPVTDKDAELEALRAELKDLKTKMGVGEAEKFIDFSNGARYEYVGGCSVCGTPVYKCITHPIRDDGSMGNRIAVFVVGARPPIPTMPGEDGIEVEQTVTCQVHDPHKRERMNKGKARAAGEPLEQEMWEPQMQVRL